MTAPPLVTGSIVSVGDAEEERSGRVKSVRGSKVEVEFYDRPGFLFWFDASKVRAGSATPRPVLLAKVLMARKGRGREQTIEVRPVCRHLHLKGSCPDCRQEESWSDEVV